MIHRHRNEDEQAIEAQRRVLAIEEKTLGSGHPRVGGTLNNLANALREAGEPEQAIAALERALEIFLASVGDQHRFYFMTLHNLGDAQRTAGMPDKALGSYGRALDGYAATLGDDHPLVGQCLYEVGMVYRSSGRLGEAREALSRSVELVRRVRTDHPDLVDVLRELGEIEHELGDDRSAVATLEEALRVAEVNEQGKGDRAQIIFRLAQACRRTAPERASALVARAAELYTEDENPEDAEEVRAWIADAGL